MKRAWPVMAWVALTALLLVLRLRWRTDALFWDEFCYVGQARFLAAHALDWPAYHTLDFLRPVLYTGTLAALIRAGLSDVAALRIATCVIGLVLLPLIHRLARALGGGAFVAWAAVLLCAASPLYLAQIGLVLSDVPATVLATAALIALIRRRTLAFVALAVLATWTKESAWVLGAPAALLLYLRQPRQRRSIWPLWPAAVPGLALFVWLLAHRALVGVALPKVNNAMVGPTGIPEALLNNLVEGGRLPMVLLAGILLWRLRRAQAASLDTHVPSPAAATGTALDTSSVWATAATVAALPFMFPAPLPRYMMLSLPLLCVLAGLALESFAVRSRLACLGALLALLALGHRPSWHTRGGYHLDDSLAYRALLATQTEAVRAVHARGGKILATFPLYDALLSSADDRFPQRSKAESVTYTTAELSDAVLCAHDLLVDADQGEASAAVLSRLKLELLETVGEAKWQVRIYRVACPEGQLTR